MPRVKGPRTVKFELIHPQELNGEIAKPYQLMSELVEKFHPSLAQARVALAWRRSLKPDKDGHLMLGKCKKVSDLEKELMPFDFIILLNQEVYNDAEFTDEKRKALLDHELCHADEAVDKEGLPKLDDKGRKAWRTKKHDIEEFYAVVERHGLYKRDLERLGEVIMKKRKGTNDANSSSNNG